MKRRYIPFALCPVLAALVVAVAPSAVVADPTDFDGDQVPDAVDNCPFVPNPSQTNSDSGPALPASNIGFLARGPGGGISSKDVTVPNGDETGDACDDDDDNDGLANVYDTNPLVSGGPCAAFAGSADGSQAPSGGDVSYADGTGTSWDTDADGVPDGRECDIGTNPRVGDPAHRLACEATTSTGDTDGDGLPDAWELCGWGTNPQSLDSDGDGLDDCLEALDVNGNRVLTNADATLVRQVVFGIIAGDRAAMDVNRNAAITNADALVIQKAVFHTEPSATSCGPAPSPPSVTPTPPVPAGTRDKYLWPFSAASPWNLPIGSGAEYVALNLPRTTFYAELEFPFLSPTSPLRTLRNNYTWPATCGGGDDQGLVRIPDGTSIAQGGPDYKPNNTAGALRADGRTIQEFAYASRCAGTDDVFSGFVACSHDIYGDGGIGRYCAHGGSGLSSVGGSLRTWEVNGTAPIAHVLKLTMPSYLLSSCNGGFRWPAVAADQGYDSLTSSQRYVGAVCDFRMGSLAAIPPAIDCRILVASSLAQRVCQALQDYGAYVVDVHPSWDPTCGCPRTDWRPMTINVEASSAPTLTAIGSELLTIVQNLSAVTNNSPLNVGGGGTRRAPLAPPIGN